MTFMRSQLFLGFFVAVGLHRAWGVPTRNIFGWQKPCYLLGEGYVKTFKELMETTEWDKYGTGKYEKCADCMAHCGYEPTAATAAINHPLQVLKVALFGIKTEGEMAPEISLDQQRPAEYIFSRHVEREMAAIHAKATKHRRPRRCRRRSRLQSHSLAEAKALGRTFGPLARLNCWEGTFMEDHRTTRMFGLALGLLFTCCMVLNAFAF